MLNVWGLYDIAGNVFEWMDSLYDSSRSYRVIRGGSWLNDAERCRSANRDILTPDYRLNYIGFRLVFVPELAKAKIDRDAAFLRANREPVAPPVPVSAKRFAIGQEYGGGIIFYLDESGQSGLIAAKSDIPGPYFTWSDAKAACNNFVSGGFSDWRLPTKDELNKLYFNISVVGGFAAYYYWSSTENGADNAWGQYFGSGYQYQYGKPDTFRVRAVRAFTYLSI
jgi:formylglycine-generating enzyme required for sulfatase activity